ncbi:MAG: Eco57I restriction-modification methylase domain-containing protein [Clostridia bacterium]|nr:Eco57I restriction-modification methylase domain-containing protein [Clostridia bacterium]
MSENLFNTIYNPDVLSCIANLSNDEVFTPPDVANAMLDMLPQELFSDPNTKFLDPACKSGVFLREIAKRLLIGLEDQFPDLQERVDHIFQHQLYGIAITELTSLLSRRSLYCSKYPNSVYSVTKFDDVQGGVRFKTIPHRWSKGRCVFCGASESEYGGVKREGMETHAYEFIHTIHPQEIMKMKFDVIISNPPYQLNTTDSSKQAKPLYNLFVEQAKKLNPRYLTMIIPSRWFAGGMGLDEFRNTMMKDRHITRMVDYANAKECFPQNSISGGVCYFLRERDNTSACRFTNIVAGNENTEIRELNEFPVMVRYNKAVDILRKIRSKNEITLSEFVSSISPFGLSTKVRGQSVMTANCPIKLYSSAGESYISSNDVQKGQEYFKKYKLMISQTGAEHAGEPGKDGSFRVLTSTMKPLGPNEVCTHSYLVVGPYDDNTTCENLLSYMKTRFVRFLILQAMSSIHLTKSTFVFVPNQDYSKPWDDDELFKKYNLSDDEVSFIESMIKPMEQE